MIFGLESSIWNKTDTDKVSVKWGLIAEKTIITDNPSFTIVCLETVWS